jgi:hypothetical protein
MDGVVRMLLAGELVAHSEVKPVDVKQDYFTVRIEVWPCDSRCNELFVLEHRGLQ